MKLQTCFVEKPWGRTLLPPVFGDPGGRRIGEIWFSAPDGVELPLLIKYIFTSERLSIQVHPDDEQAQQRGLPHGKSECWYIVDAEPGAVIGLGLKEEVSPETLRAAALDGSIERLMNWIPVQAGDIFNVPAGTIHAIGAGISLLEVQQNIDVTYRLYDYGRPRDLHLDDAISVARPGPYPLPSAHNSRRSAKHVLIDEPHFTLVRIQGQSREAEKLGHRDRWLIPLAGAVLSLNEISEAGSCLFAPAGTPVRYSGDALILVSAAGPFEPARRIAA